MPSTISFRRAGEADVPLMQEIELDAAQAYLASADHAFCASVPAHGATAHARVRRNGMALIAERDSVGIGFILVLRLDVFAHIFEVGVRQTHQGQGIGRRLIAMAEDWAKKQALSEITLTTFPDVSWNGPFYQKLGFKEFSPGKDRPELQAIIDYEASSGLAQARRITMRKDLF